MTSGLEGSPVCYSTYKLGFWELVPFILKALEGRAAAKEARGGDGVLDLHPGRTAPAAGGWRRAPWDPESHGAVG